MPAGALATARTLSRASVTDFDGAAALAAGAHLGLDLHRELLSVGAANATPRSQKQAARPARTFVLIFMVSSYRFGPQMRPGDSGAVARTAANLGLDLHGGSYLSMRVEVWAANATLVR
jgi:hypothetical protein